MRRGILGEPRRDDKRIVKFDAHYTYRRGYAQWPSSMVWICPKKKCKQRHPQSDGADSIGHQTTRTSQEDMAPTDQGRHDGCGCNPGYGPRPERVDRKVKADS